MSGLGQSFLESSKVFEKAFNGELATVVKSKGEKQKYEVEVKGPGETSNFDAFTVASFTRSLGFDFVSSMFFCVTKEDPKKTPDQLVDLGPIWQDKLWRSKEKNTCLWLPATQLWTPVYCDGDGSPAKITKNGMESWNIQMVFVIVMVSSGWEYASVKSHIFWYNWPLNIRSLLLPRYGDAGSWSLCALDFTMFRCSNGYKNWPLTSRWPFEGFEITWSSMVALPRWPSAMRSRSDMRRKRGLGQWLRVCHTNWPTTCMFFPGWEGSWVWACWRSCCAALLDLLKK